MHKFLYCLVKVDLKKQLTFDLFCQRHAVLGKPLRDGVVCIYGLF